MGLTPARALARLTEAQGAAFVTLFERGSLCLEIYRPRGVDPQQPHDRDELYFVISGTGVFESEQGPQPFEPGQALFVAAGVPHRFVDFTDDFATWVVFYGPRGGEPAGAGGEV